MTVVDTEEEQSGVSGQDPYRAERVDGMLGWERDNSALSSTHSPNPV